MYGLPALVVCMDQALRGTFRCFITMHGISRPSNDPGAGREGSVSIRRRQSTMKCRLRATHSKHHPGL